MTLAVPSGCGLDHQQLVECMHALQHRDTARDCQISDALQVLTCSIRSPFSVLYSMLRCAALPACFAAQCTAACWTHQNPVLVTL